uniref:C-type lectin n=1 Tax=Rotylenchulus reniformis TaxID=239373 RepID=I6R422_ROTRE|nr:C-type lectin [Rotylenchulus reniformis]
MNSLAVFCLVAASVLLGANACKEGWSGFKDHCYKLFTNEKGLNWDEALGKCKSFEANLASVHSEEENKFIGELITKAGDKKHCYWNGMRLERNPYGGKDVKGSSWTDGSAVDYADPTKVKNKTPWLRGEPNGEPDEYCVMYWGLAPAGAGVEAWNDLACARRATADSEKLGAVCKAPRKDGGTEPTTTTTSGYGTTTTGYGTASTTTGYGTASTTAGYGTASTTTGYGTASTTTGYGTASTTTGYGSTSTPTTAGYGTTSTTAGYGTTSTTTAGYGSTSTPTTAGYGTTSTASTTTTGYGTESTTRGGYGGASSTTTSTPSSTTTKDAKYGYGKFGSR